MNAKLNGLIRHTIETSLVSEPLFYRLKDKDDKAKFEELLHNNPHLAVFDELSGQVEEYVKSKNPKTVFGKTALTDAAKLHIGQTPAEEYGVWVFYPWSNRLVHILDEEEFVEVRTNRNQYKITPEEKAILSKKKIGVIGLSVGQSIALTIAMERICGELRLADFDILELSNLNRIRAGVHDLGVAKTIVAKREILEIDPYLNITCYGDGLTEENVDDFFNRGGKLDVCIEVCDGLYTKVVARQKAKEYGVPVVMNSSDRGTTDIERYDLDPSQPLLHGLIDHLDLGKVKDAKTNEEKVPYLLPMLGVESSTDRLKASMIEIQETITTWPQLSSGVVLGGAICTDVCRRILLNQLKNSGRYFVDLEELISDNAEDYISKSKNAQEEIHILPASELKDYEPVLKELALKAEHPLPGNIVSLSADEITELVKAGSKAPSAGNVQPWKWLYRDKKFMLFHDQKRALSILNFNNTASLIGLGAATENVILKAHELNYEVILDQFPLGNESMLIAVFNFYSAKDKSADISFTQSHEDDHLAGSIAKRITNRNLGKRQLIKTEDLTYLQETIKHIPGAELQLFSDPEKMEELKGIITEIDWIIMTNKSCHNQFMSEIRWNRKEVERTKDGLDIESFDITPTEKAGLLVSRNWNVPRHIKEWNLGKKFGEMSRKAIDSASALGLITLPVVGVDSYFEGGRALQKVWLAATEKGISIQPLSLSTFLSERVKENKFELLEDVEEKIKSAYTKLIAACNIPANRKDIFLFRLSFAPEPFVKPLRRNIEDVLMNG